jgi:hypothetical protein
MARKGNVKVNGRTLTTTDYSDAVVEALRHNGNNWMTVNQIIAWASDNKLVEKKNAPRQAVSHPLWKIISMMMYDTQYKGVDHNLERSVIHGKYAYRLKNADYAYINGNEIIDI